MRYRVELDQLLQFPDALQTFERRAESALQNVGGQVAHLYATWSGVAAQTHQAGHDQWMSAVSQMCDALAELRATAHRAHRHYTDADALNLTMLE